MAVILLLGAGFLYMMQRNRSLSPIGETSFSKEGVDLSVAYSRPSVKGRVIFGAGEEALQPFGVYWRLGANESTEITFSKAVTIQGNKLEAGTHKLYCYPGEKEFVFAFAPADGAWGFSEPDREDEHFRVAIPVTMQSETTEQFTITALDGEGKAIDVHCDFNKHRLSLSFEPTS